MYVEKYHRAIVIFHRPRPIKASPKLDVTESKSEVAAESEEIDEMSLFNEKNMMKAIQLAQSE
jgi:hypothetical protein